MTEKLQRTHLQLRTPKSDDGRILFHPILMMHASSLSGFTYEEFMRDHRKLVAANLKCLEMYDHDAVSVISDSYREASAFGARITFDGNYSPKPEKRILSESDIDGLENPDIMGCERTRDRIDGVRLFRKELGSGFPLIGWVEGALAEASDLMGMSEIMMEMVMNPGMVKRLTEKTLVTAKDFARAQVEAGANIIGVGDAVCSQISQEMYDEFVSEQHKELFDYIHSLGASVKVHICGNITHLLPSLAKEDIDILDVDWMVDMADAYSVMGGDVVLAGNLDPVAVIMDGTKELIREKYEAVKASIPAENWIMMGGCEIPMHTNPDNMKYLREISLAR